MSSNNKLKCGATFSGPKILSDVQLSNYPIPRKKTSKFFGVCSNCSLRSGEHIEYICVKINKFNGIATKMRNLLPEKILSRFINSVAVSIISYDLPK